MYVTRDYHIIKDLFSLLKILMKMM